MITLKVDMWYMHQPKRGPAQRAQPAQGASIRTSWHQEWPGVAGQAATAKGNGPRFHGLAAWLPWAAALPHVSVGVLAKQHVQRGQASVHSSGGQRVLLHQMHSSIML